MSRPFKNSSSANNTFGQFKEPKDAGDYIYNKKARSTYCVANSCHPSIKVTSEQNKLLFHKSNQLSLYPCRNILNPANLNINLITRLNLNGVEVIKDLSNNASPSTINSSLIPFLNYEIDPNGRLFGDSICGIYNFKRYLRPELILPEKIIIDGYYYLSSDPSYNTVITFTANSTVRILGDLLINYIVVGGGGGGGGGNSGGSPGAGGGGGGGVATGTFNSNILTTYNIIVGGGGGGGTLQTSTSVSTDGGNGSSSQISGIVTVSGGLGGKSSQNLGAGGNSGNGGAGGSGNTNPGGNGTNGGGGGGGSYTPAKGGNGAITSTSAYNYGTVFGAGGGGGGGDDPQGGFGGNAFAGDGGRPGQDGKPNYGGGGGGGVSGNGVPGTYGSGGNGGSGVVIFLLNV